MQEGERGKFSLDTIKITARYIFRENDAYDDEKGLHPNTIRRSSEKAVEKIIADYGITSVDLYASLKTDESLPDIKHLREMGFTDEEVDRSIKAMFTTLVHKAIVSENPDIVSDQEYRLKQYGRIYLKDE